MKVERQIISHKFLYHMYCVYCTVLCICGSLLKSISYMYPRIPNLPYQLPTSPYSIKPLPPHPPPTRIVIPVPHQLVKINDSTPPWPHSNSYTSMSEILSKVPPPFHPSPPPSLSRLAHYDVDFDVDLDDVDDEECVANREILDKFVQ